MSSGVSVSVCLGVSVSVSVHACEEAMPSSRQVGLHGIMHTWLACSNHACKSLVCAFIFEQAVHGGRPPRHTSLPAPHCRACLPRSVRLIAMHHLLAGMLAERALLRHHSHLGSEFPVPLTLQRCPRAAEAPGERGGWRAGGCTPAAQPSSRRAGGSAGGQMFWVELRQAARRLAAARVCQR